MEEEKKNLESKLTKTISHFQTGHTRLSRLEKSDILSASLIGCLISVLIQSS